LIPSGIGQFGAATAGSDRKLAKPISVKIISRIFIEFFVTIIGSSFLVLKIQSIFIKKGQFRKGREEKPQRDLKSPWSLAIGHFRKSIS
jgi:hypothetical protein